MLEIKRIKFDERYDDEEYGTTTLYFIAPKEMLKDFMRKKNYPEAVSMEISIEFPTEHIESDYASVCVSPTNANGEDYDWFDADLPCDEINKLILLAKREINKKKKFILTITYNFDGDYLAEAYDTEEDAVIMLNQYLLQEIDTVKTESGYTPSVLTHSDTDKTLVYCEGCTKDSGYDHEEDCAYYRIFEVYV